MAGWGARAHEGLMCRMLASAACMACVALVCGVLAGCGGNDGKDSADDGSSGKSDPFDRMMSENQGQKLASSLDAYIDKAIKDMETDQYTIEADPTGKAREHTLDVLRAAKERGGLTVSEYESAWAGYKQCMLDRGYKEIILIKQSNGLYKEAAHRGGTPEQEVRFSDDQTDCKAMNVFGIDSVYQAQVGNPGLYRNVFEGILDCFRRENLAPKGYDMDDLEHDLYEAREPEDFIVNPESAGAQACFLGNGMYVGSSKDPLAELW